MGLTRFQQGDADANVITDLRDVAARGFGWGMLPGGEGFAPRSRAGSREGRGRGGVAASRRVALAEPGSILSRPATLGGHEVGLTEARFPSERSPLLFIRRFPPSLRRQNCRLELQEFAR